MTKKHYEAIARIIRHYIESCQISKECEVLDELADYFEQDNPRFLREKFLKACGVEQDATLVPFMSAHRRFCDETETCTCDCECHQQSQNN
jgi:hypothetical protein